MESPADIPRFIALTSKKKLDRDDAKAWFGCVRRHAPPGCLMAIQIMKPRGGLQSVSMVHRETTDGHEYVVPLGRDLSTDEAKKIFDAWVMARPELKDFDIEASVAVTAGEKVKPPAIVSKDRFDSLCMALAKRRHEAWVRERTDDGWRYATTLSMENKTHPLLRPWDQLPERYRKPERDTPQMVMDLLQQQGYAVVGQQEIDALAKALRSIA